MAVAVQKLDSTISLGNTQQFFRWNLCHWGVYYGNLKRRAAGMKNKKKICANQGMLKALKAQISWSEAAETTKNVLGNGMDSSCGRISGTRTF